MKHRILLVLLSLALGSSACQDQPTQPEMDISSLGPAYDLEPLWGPDSKIAFTGVPDEMNWTTNIFVMNDDGTGSTNITPDCSECDDPNWSPDGSKIAFDKKVGEDWEIFVMNADGTEQVQLTDNAGNDWSPVWSPSGDKILFMGEAGDWVWDIWVMDPDGSGLTNLTNTATSSEKYPTWSPNGAQIAFMAGDALTIMNSDGSGEPSVLYSGGGGYSDPFPVLSGEIDWSPDGTQIVAVGMVSGPDYLYTRPCYGKGINLYTIGLDGSDPVSLTGECTTFNVYQPSWSPDGTQITFLRNDHGGGYFPDIFVMLAEPGSDQIGLNINTSYDEVWAPDWGLVPAAPPPPEEIVDLIGGAVEDLVGQGVLNPGEASALTVKLDAVKRRVDQGKVTPAVNLLGAFINQVNAMVNSGKISAADAQVLIDAAQDAIDQLGG